MRAGVDPRSVDTISLYELAEMNEALRKMDRKQEQTMSDGDFDALIERVRAMNLPDVKL